jgi:hypothetical protein
MSENYAQRRQYTIREKKKVRPIGNILTGVKIKTEEGDVSQKLIRAIQRSVNLKKDKWKNTEFTEF